jgi:hypothetical protein
VRQVVLPDRFHDELIRERLRTKRLDKITSIRTDPVRIIAGSGSLFYALCGLYSPFHFGFRTVDWGIVVGFRVGRTLLR